MDIRLRRNGAKATRLFPHRSWKNIYASRKSCSSGKVKAIHGIPIIVQDGCSYPGISNWTLIEKVLNKLCKEADYNGTCLV